MSAARVLVDLLADQQVIELHATFLELNLLSQIRALPNPSYNASSPHRPHALTLHLSPTSTANIIVTSLTPPPPSSSPFARISPDAEVIVAPKTHVRPSPSGHRDSSRSVASVGKKSVGARSRTSTSRRKSHREEGPSRGPLFFRGVDRRIDGPFFPDEREMANSGLRAWVDADTLASNQLRGTQWVSVSVFKPATLNEPIDPSQQGPTEEDSSKDRRPAKKVIASIAAWEGAPSARHVALSSALCASLGCEGMVGGIVRMEAAPPQVSKTAVTALKVYPFQSPTTKAGEGLKFGGESKAEREEAARAVREMYGTVGDDDHALLHGPLTDGLLLARTDRAGSDSWQGGLLRFEPSVASEPGNASKPPSRWLLGGDRKLEIEVQQAIARPPGLGASLRPGDPIPDVKPVMVGIDALIAQLSSHLSHSSSVLLTGALGSGKTSLAKVVGHQQRGQ